MLTFYFHIAWFSFLFSFFLLSSLVTLSLVFSGSLFISLDLLFVAGSPLTLSFYLDFISLSFISVVSLISSVIMIYSFNYMSPYSNSPYFIWLTSLFILSMLLVVSMSSLFFVILGWDGLGVVSFFLIVFYQNQSSITSGLFTLFINRLGDCFFLVTLSLFYFTQTASLSFVPSCPGLGVCILMCLTFMTNSALFPFSPWLPLAMAAPTPISALVHSSTLVTSGLFLMMRYSYFILISPEVVNALIVVSVFTSFYAGLNSVFEKDLNKLIALSTLSHLGFIGLAFSSGLVILAFFHLLSHALFKSLLFMAMGDTIVNLSHSQDIRYLSSGLTVVPSSSSYILISVLNLLGIPALSGFFSNDLVLETLNFSSVSTILEGLVYLNVFLTFFYSLQLVFFCFQPSNNGAFSLVHMFSLPHSISVFLLSLTSVCFGYIFLNIIFSSVQFLCLPLLVNLLPFSILCLALLFLFIQERQMSYFSPLIFNYFSSIINLSVVLMPLSSRLFLSTSHLVNTSELGLYTCTLNSVIPSISLYQSQSFLLGLYRPFYFTLFSAALFITISL